MGGAERKKSATESPGRGRAREGEFALKTRALVALASESGKDCVEAREIAQRHLDAVRARLAELQVLERSLGAFVTACTEQCAGGPAPQCTILKDLSLAGPGPGPAFPRSEPAPAARCCG